MRRNLAFHLVIICIPPTDSIRLWVENPTYLSAQIHEVKILDSLPHLVVSRRLEGLNRVVSTLVYILLVIKWWMRYKASRIRSKERQQAEGKI